MARIINSAGVQVQETDLSLRVNTPAGTTTYVTGFADQGPTDEVVGISSLPEFESIYGLPTNAAERYFYHTAKATLASSSNVLVNRLPWGADTGEGFGSKIGVLAYPVLALSANSTYTTAVTSQNLDLAGNVTYVLGKPTQYNITKEEYLSILNNETFTWSATATSSFATLSTLGQAGLLVFNKSQTTIDNKYRGFYLGISDNTNINPASAYDAIRKVETVTSTPDATGSTDFTVIPDSRLAFALTASPAYGSNPANNSVSQILEEKIVGYDTSTHEFDDTLNIGVFKLRQSVFTSDTNALDYVLDEGYNAAIGASRQIYNDQGGQPVNFFLETVVNEKSDDIKVVVNPYMSKSLSRVVLNSDGTPTNKIRVYSKQLVDNLTNGNVTATEAGFTTAALANVVTYFGSSYSDSLFAVGAYSDAYTNSTSTKLVGNLPSKLQRALEKVRNDDVYEIDTLVEGGLGTIWATAGQNFFFDDQTPASITNLRNSSVTLADTTARDAYMSIANCFTALAGAPKDGGRGDLVFLGDPLRQTLVTGTNNKVLDDPTKNFTIGVYWALRHQFEMLNTSYAAVAANWVKVYDNNSGTNVWVPTSGFVAALLAANDAAVGPWDAAAGTSKGVLNGILDIAFSPNQRQRDDLYKINLNPIAQFPSYGVSLYGQKTLSRKPSAFDRLNVRRLFLYVERAVKKTMLFFVFEPNNAFTRSRVVNTLTPLFERIKAAGGIIDYRIVCETKNNPGNVIDNNELVVDIYIKPSRTAEFILVNFSATATDANFDEIIG